MPLRGDIDPIEIPTLLPHLQFVERAEDGEYRYRLTGSAIVDAYGLNPKGKGVVDFFGEERAVLASRYYTRVFDTCRPLFVQSRFVLHSYRHLQTTRVLLPLALNGEGVALILMGQTFDYDRRLPATLGTTAQLDPDEEKVEFLA